MALPKRRTSKARRDIRHSHPHLTPAKPPVCAHCKQPKAPHRICKNCGYYSGVEVIAPKE